MKKPAVKPAVKKPSLKEPVQKEVKPRKKFSVTLLVEGDMLDKDTPISEESLAALFQLQFQSEKVIKILRTDVKEVKEQNEPPINQE